MAMFDGSEDTNTTKKALNWWKDVVEDAKNNSTNNTNGTDAHEDQNHTKLFKAFMKDAH